MSMMSLGRRALAPVVLCCALVPVATAAAADDPVPIVSGAGADWGVKASFRNYVVGPIAHGAIAVADGATTNPDGTFHFPVKSGIHDPLTGTTIVRFGGSVRFTGHEGQLDLKLSDPRLELTPDGSSLYADMMSKTSLEATEVTPFPNVRVAATDLTGKTPTSAGGTTTWTGLPETLAPDAASAFAGFYAAGTALDPITFAYDGPGGAPLVESWSLPGVARFGKVATATLTSGVRSLAFDPVRGRVWSTDSDRASITALNESDLSEIASVDMNPDNAFFNPRNVAVDQTTGDAYGVDAQIARVTESDGAFALDPTPVDTLGGGTNALDSTPDGTIYTVKGDQLITYKSGVRKAYTLPQDYDNLTALDDGTLYVYGQFMLRSIGVVTLSGTTATVQDVPDTLGVTSPGFTTDGSFYYGADGKLFFVEKTATGWDKAQVPGVTSGIGGGYVAVTGDGSTVYVADPTSSALTVVDHGQVVDSIGPDGLLSDVETAPDGRVYAVWRNGHLARLGQVGTTPAFTTAPRDVTVEAGQAATFTAAATGDDAPTIAWQTRAPGTTRWTEVATGPTATLADPATGTRVRAIATNAAGAVASDPATVTVDAPTDDPPGDGDGGGGTTGTTDTTNNATPPAPAPPATPTPTTPITKPTPKPAPKAARLTAPRSAKVATTRRATVLTLTCGSTTCTVTAPKTVKVKIGGRTYKLTVTAPTRLAAGKKGTVRVRLSAAAYRALRGHKATAKVKVVLTAGGRKTTKTASVALRR